MKYTYKMIFIFSLYQQYILVDLFYRQYHKINPYLYYDSNKTITCEIIKPKIFEYNV